MSPERRGRPHEPLDEEIWADWRGPNLSGAIYGLIVITSVLAVWSVEHGLDAWTVLASVASTALVFWAAHVYSELTAFRIRSGRRNSMTEVGAVIRHEWPVAEVAALPVAVLLLSILGAFSVHLAVSIGLYGSLAELGLLGLYSSYRASDSWWRMILESAITLGFGLAIVALKIFIH
jgi:hypothetical protein